MLSGKQVRLGGRHTLSSILVLAAGSVSAAPTASAQQDEEPLDTLVVTATRTETEIDSSGTSISVLTAGDIALRQAGFVTDLLRSLPGVTGNRNGGLGGSTDIIIRGIGGGRVLVLVDGVEVNDASTSRNTFNFANLVTDNIERIEVLRGSQGSLWGSDAIGGVINIITKQPAKPISARFSAEGGSFGTRQFNSGISGRRDQFWFDLSAAHINTTGISAADAINGNSEKDRYKNATLASKAGVQLGNIGKISGHVRFTDGTNEFDSFDSTFGVRDGDERSETERLDGRIAFDASLLDGKFDNKLFAAWTETDRLFLVDGGEDSSFLGQRRTFGYQGNLKLHARHELIFGAESERNEMQNIDLPTDIVTTGKFDVDSFYAQLQSSPVRGAFFNASVRHENSTGSIKATVFRLAGSVAVGETGLILKSSFSEGFKLPTPFQLFSRFGDPNLEPENSSSWDMGVIWKTSEGKHRAELNYFEIEITNEIDFSFDTFRFANISSSRSKGIEAILSTNPVKGIGLSANYTYNMARVNDAIVQRARRPKHVANLQAAYIAGKFNFWLGATYNSSELDRRGPVDDFTVVDAGLSFQLNERLQIYGRVENLFDSQYQDVFGFGTQGIGAFAGLRAKY
jgi:vitamin B12 transporter